MCATEAAWLQGRTVLFVDDRPDSMVLFTSWTKNNGGNIFVRRSINGALDLIDDSNKSIDFVVIDLFLEDGDNQLKGREYPVQQTGTNQGQLLGWDLRYKNPAIPYLYLTARASSFVAENEDQRRMVFKKSPDELERFTAYLKDYLE